MAAIIRSRFAGLRRVLQAILPPIVWRLLTKVNSAALPRYYALNGLDEKLERYLDYEFGYFVELGANDGVAQSNTLFFERQKKWRGVLIEPSLNNFLKCKLVRSAENEFFCAACVPFAYREKFVELLYSNLMTVPSILGGGRISDPAEHARRGEQFLAKHECVVRFGAEARTLTAILTQAGAPKIMDLLSLDVEGAELQVLQGLDHYQYRFKYMLIEYDDCANLKDYLEPYGYRFVAQLSHHDWLFEDAISCDSTVI